MFKKGKNWYRFAGIPKSERDKDETSVDLSQVNDYDRPKYIVLDSEIGPLFFYDYNAHMEEFFTGYKSHVTGFTVIFDFCGTGFRAVDERASGNDELAIRKLTKQEFALEIDRYINKYGSKERAKADLINKINERIAYRDANLRKWEQEQARQKRLDYQSNQAIDRYGIR